MLLSSLACSHGRVLGPVLVPEVVSGAVELVRRVLVVLVHLGKDWPREGKERHKSVKIDHLESVCLHGVKAVLVRSQLLMQTVDSIIQSKEERDICLGCLGVNCQSGGGRSSFLCLLGSRGRLPLLPST